MHSLSLRESLRSRRAPSSWPSLQSRPWAFGERGGPASAAYVIIIQLDNIDHVSVGRATREKYLRINHAALLRALPSDQLEEFVDDWLDQRTKLYIEHELWRGTGDMGRDVTGYLTTQRMEGAWDNFQCKQLNEKLSEASAFVELGKIFMHAAADAYSLPNSYTFVAPRGVVRRVQHFVAHPKAFQQAIIDQWDEVIASRLVEKSTILLCPQIRHQIKSFNFTKIYWLDATRLVNDPSAMPALVKWFDADPGPWLREVVPSEIQVGESSYISQLLQLYAAKGPREYPDAATALASTEHGAHLRDQRTRFFDAMAFDRFYRDSTPADYLPAFKEEIYHGVVDTHRDDYASGLTRLNEVMKRAGVLQPSGILGKHAGIPVKQGTCHQFSNEGRLPWHP